MMTSESISYLKRLYAYDVWANREMLASLQSLEAPPEQTVSLLAHIIAAEWLWLGRLTRQDYGIPVWPTWTLDTCAGQLNDLAPRWETYIEPLTPEMLIQDIEYVNSKGESWTSGVHDVIMHVIIHAGYHRGQMAAAVRASGNAPAYTDFIHATRKGLLV